MHSSILQYLRERLEGAKQAPDSAWRSGAIEELEELIYWIEEEAFIEDWEER